MYSNCWEDAEIVNQALNITSGNIYLSIASAGDNTLSILAHDPGFVLAVDKNPAQLACLDLKRAAIKHLSYSETLAFLGITASDNRLAIYLCIRDVLTPFSRCFWDDNPKAIKQGFIHTGITERNFTRFRKLILPLILSTHDRHQLLSEIPLSARRKLCKRVLNRPRYRYIIRTVFSRPVVRQFRIGTYSTFHDSCNGALADTIKVRITRGLSSPLASKNPYLMYVMTGNYNHALPHYLQKPVFDRIKETTDRLVLFTGTLQQALTAYSDRSFNGYNLSDIFEYMNPENFHYCICQLVDRASKGARLVYWNTLQKHRASQFSNGRLRTVDDRAHSLFEKNMSFFYDTLNIDEVY
jgi:S-adenosylmethionine-diacylglycerol 3-amino-3-carboxypropyl transferase